VRYEHDLYDEVYIDMACERLNCHVLMDDCDLFDGLLFDLTDEPTDEALDMIDAECAT
jgi:hypothetical protein